MQGIVVDDERIIEPGIETVSSVSTQDDETQCTNAPRHSYWESDTADVYRRNVRAHAEYYILHAETMRGNKSRTVLSRALWGDTESSEKSESKKSKSILALENYVNKKLQDLLKEKYLEVEFSLVIDSRPCPQGEVLLMVDKIVHQ